MFELELVFGYVSLIMIRNSKHKSPSQMAAFMEAVMDVVGIASLASEPEITIAGGFDETADYFPAYLGLTAAGSAYGLRDDELQVKRLKIDHSSGTKRRAPSYALEPDRRRSKNYIVTSAQPGFPSRTFYRGKWQPNANRRRSSRSRKRKYKSVSRASGRS